MNQMINRQERDRLWNHFEQTGRIGDYLNYARVKTYPPQAFGGPAEGAATPHAPDNQRHRPAGKKGAGR